jgi:hypothetical protein
LQALSAESVQAGLQRPVGATVVAPKLVGNIDLKERQFYIAEYQVLIEIGGELVLPQTDGWVLGQAVTTPAAQVTWQTSPDVRALQLLVDHGWADLRARLQAAGLPLMTAKALLGVTPAVYEATSSATTTDHWVTVNATVGDRQHRYLVLAPSGMNVVPRSAAGLDPGNVLARVTHLSQKIEALSLGVTFNLSGQDPAGVRPSPYAVGNDADAAMAQAVAPWLEVAAVPVVPLIDTHVQGQSVRLAEALTLKPEFGRLTGAATAPSDKGDAKPDVLAGPISAALSLGRLVGWVAPPMAALQGSLELDGPGLSRGLVYGLFSANQAMVNALLAAR